MSICTRNGCKKSYEENSDERCLHHPGNPVFHEGLKSWSCCKEINKPVLDFESFITIPGCTSADKHTDAKSTTNKSAARNATSADTVNAIPLKLTQESDGSEVYTSVHKKVDLPTAMMQGSSASTFSIEEDDLSAPVAQGAKCQRKGCNDTFISDEASRTGNAATADCYFHPAPPLFREGSKGYLCCKRRVLEFDEFLKIPGCTKGRHCFVPKSNQDQPATTNVTCRLDYYQTPREVIISVFAKQSDKEKSQVIIEENKLKLDVLMPAAKRFQRIIELYGPVDVSSSSFQILQTKIEIKLAKLDGRSWNMLEKSENPSGALNLTFGVGGRIGTVGSKEMVLGADNKPASR